MDRHKKINLNGVLEFIMDGESGFEDISDSDSDFEPDDSTAKTITTVRKLGTQYENQDTPKQHGFEESDEDDIILSNMVNSSTNTAEKWGKNVPVWKKVFLNDVGDITF